MPVARVAKLLLSAFCLFVSFTFFMSGAKSFSIIWPETPPPVSGVCVCACVGISKYINNLTRRIFDLHTICGIFVQSFIYFLPLARTQLTESKPKSKIEAENRNRKRNRNRNRLDVDITSPLRDSLFRFNRLKYTESKENLIKVLFKIKSYP